MSRDNASPMDDPRCPECGTALFTTHQIQADGWVCHFCEVDFDESESPEGGDLLAPTGIHTPMGSRDDIPSPVELADMNRNELRSLAAENDIPAGRERTADWLRKHLLRLRNGGIVLQCPACGWRWVYIGESAVRTSCPQCTSSVRIEKNHVH